MKAVKLNYQRTILVGLAFLTISAFWQMYDFYIPLILKYTFAMSDTVAGVIMSADNITALILLPLFGILSDRTKTRIGRRMPFILVGTILAALSITAIPYAAQTQNLPVFLTALAAVLIAMAVYRSPAVALMPDITPKPLRSAGNAVINLMGALGGALILLLNAFLAPNVSSPAQANYWPIFLVTAGIMLTGTLILLLTINEPQLVKEMRQTSAALGIDIEEAAENPVQVKTTLSAAEKKSMALLLASIALWFTGYNAVTTAFSKYAVARLGMTEGQASLILMVAVIAAVIAFIPVGIISTRIGRKKSIMFGIVLLTLDFGSAAFYTAYSPLMFGTFALAGFAWAAINVNSLPMVLEMSKGESLGKYTGYYYTSSMAAQVITPILSGALLEHVGYFTLLPYAAFFIGLSFLTMSMVRHGDTKPIAPASPLQAFDAGD